MPADLSDPWFKQWIKPETNPFLAQVLVSCRESFSALHPSHGMLLSLVWVLYCLLHPHKSQSAVHHLLTGVQVPPGGTNAQFRDPTEGRHGTWLALTSRDNPYRLSESSYAIAIGGQAHCMVS